MMYSQIIKWNKRYVSEVMKELPTIGEFRAKIPECSENIKHLTTSQGKNMYHVHLNYNFKKTILYSHSNGECLLLIF